MKINVAAIFIGNKFEDKYQGSKFPKYKYLVDYDYYPEGYIIHNLYFNDIDISKVDPIKKTIKSGEKVYLTIDQIIFILFENKQKLEIENGKFKHYPIHNDQDILFDFYFEPSSEFSDYFNLYDSNARAVKAVYLSNKSTILNPLSLIWFLKEDKDHKVIKKGIGTRTLYFGKEYTYVEDLADWLNNNCSGPNNYNYFCSSITTALTDHLNIKHDLKNNKIKSKKSDEIIKYNGEVISNPVEFNVPNATGDIKRSTKKDKMNAEAAQQIFYSWTTLKNFNFGNLNIYKYDAEKYGDDSYNPTIQKRVTKFFKTKFNMTLDESLETAVLDRCSGYIKNLNLVKREKNRPRIIINNDLTIDSLKINKDFSEISYESSQMILKINNLTSDENKIKIRHRNEKITLDIGELNYTGDKDELKIDYHVWKWGSGYSAWTFNLNINKINNPKIKKLTVMNACMKDNLNFMYNNKKLTPIKVLKTHDDRCNYFFSL